MPTVLISSAAHVLSDYLLGSEGTHCYNFFKQMNKYGYEFEVLSGYIRLQRQLSNAHFHQVGPFEISPTSPAHRRLVFHGAFLCRSLVEAKRILSRKKIDIVHHMLPAVFGYTISPIALLGRLKPPLVFGPISKRLCCIPFSERVLFPLTSRLHNLTIKKCAKLITITNQVKSSYKTTFDESDISVIPFGVDTELFKPASLENPNAQCEILYAGALYPLKGVHNLIRATAIVIKHGLKATLTVVGEGPQRDALTAMTKTLGIEKHVRFTGFVPYSNMPEHYKRCDIFCFPTMGEPFGRAVVEAMACGKPVIATNNGGPAEIIQNKVDGILVPPSDPEEIALQIMRLISDTNERRRLGDRARKSAVNRFSWSKIADKYHELYSGLL